MERVTKDKSAVPYGDSIIHAYQQGCSHNMARHCVAASAAVCNYCCTRNHSMVLDGMEGFQKKPVQGR